MVILWSLLSRDGIEPRLLPQDRRMELLQGRTRIDPEFLDENLPPFLVQG